MNDLPEHDPRPEIYIAERPAPRGTPVLTIANVLLGRDMATCKTRLHRQAALSWAAREGTGAKRWQAIVREAAERRPGGLATIAIAMVIELNGPLHERCSVAVRHG